MIVGIRQILFRPRWLGVCALALVLPALGPAARAFAPPPLAVDDLMNQDPQLPADDDRGTFDPRLLGLWRQALDRPDADTQRLAADAIAAAHRRGMTGLEVTADRLTQLVRDGGTQRVARLASAAALVELHPQAAAPLLRQRAGGDDLDMTLLADTALAQWDYRPARTDWLARIRSAEANPAARDSAAAALAAVHEPAAVQPLLAIVLDPRQPGASRLAAARALAVLAPPNLQPPCAALTRPAQAPALDRLLAATILAGQQGPEAQTLLLALARDPEPAVAAAALCRLVELRSDQLGSLAHGACSHPDSGVRAAAVAALALVGGSDSIHDLTARLGDDDPQVGEQARASLRQLARQPGFDTEVSTAGRHALESPAWRGQQQAALLLGDLGDRTAASRLVEFMNRADTRVEVRLAAIHALRCLAVPDTYPALLRRLEVLTHDAEPPAVPRKGAAAAADKTRLLADANEAVRRRNAEMCQLGQALGVVAYEPGTDLLLRLAAKPPFTLGPPPPGIPIVDGSVRCAAVWALGSTPSGPASEGIVRFLSGRLDDCRGMYSEDTTIRRMSALALGRMKSRGAVPVLRRFFAPPGPDNPTTPQLRAACRWALMQVTGEPLPPIPPEVQPNWTWFLHPDR
jgi:HEAT repeat protein